jgi:hypothetical protein
MIKAKKHLTEEGLEEIKQIKVGGAPRRLLEVIKINILIL